MESQRRFDAETEPYCRIGWDELLVHNREGRGLQERRSHLNWSAVSCLGPTPQVRGSPRADVLRFRVMMPGKNGHRPVNSSSSDFQHRTSRGSQGPMGQMTANKRVLPRNDIDSKPLQTAKDFLDWLYNHCELRAFMTIVTIHHTFSCARANSTWNQALLLINF